MTYGFCHLAMIPLRESPKDSSEMMSQLLFGDVFEIIEETATHWIKIKNAYDSYEGYIDPKQGKIISPKEFEDYQDIQLINKESTSLNGSFGSISIPPGCSLIPSPFSIGDWNFDRTDIAFPLTLGSREDILSLVRQYLNAPYLWGGKTPSGIDCSGFTQMVYKMAGIKLWRDASQQATQGETLSFLEEAQPGDLAFFDNEEGQIIHVGILLSSNEIIHASGRVRIDKIDHAGIFNTELNSYTHNLRLIKKYIP